MSYHNGLVDNLRVNKINGKSISTSVSTYPINLFDSYNGNNVGMGTIYVYQVGNIVFIDVKAFTTSGALADNSSYIYTDFVVPSTLYPIGLTSGGTNQFISPSLQYTYPLALQGNIGAIAISSASVTPYALSFYGSASSVGGFGTTTAVSVFNCSCSYIIA